MVALKRRKLVEGRDGPWGSRNAVVALKRKKPASMDRSRSAKQERRGGIETLASRSER